MAPSHELLILGALLLAGWSAHALGQRVHVPRVTMLLAIGVVAGPHLLDLVPHAIVDAFPLVAHVALAMVGFLLGDTLAGKQLRESQRAVIGVSIGGVIGPALLVFAACWALTGNLQLALVLGGISAATEPAATLDIINEYRASGPVSRTVMGVVAIDDAWGVMLFSAVLVAAETLNGHGALWPEFGRALWEVIGALVLGALIGLVMSLIVGRTRRRHGEPTLVEAVGFVLLCGGIASAIGVSYLLACMALGVTVALRTRHLSRPFREIRGAAEPFLVIFFLLSGYQLDLAALPAIGAVGLAYVLARSIGKILGGRAGAALARAEPPVRRHAGWCLLPQAGIALGMGLLVAERMPELGEIVLPLVIASSVVFELFGPMITRWRLLQAGEIGASAPAASAGDAGRSQR